MDVRDRDAMRALLDRGKPDALVHLAFVLNPIRDEATMYDIDVNGTQNVLDAASAAGIAHLLVTSCTTAYGAWPDNPVPITEEHPVRGLPDYEYARDKTEIDRLCQLWAAEHPDRTMTIVRPCIVFGPNVDNYIVALLGERAVRPAVRRRVDRDFQYVHEDDVVEAISRAARRAPRGRVQPHRRRRADLAGVRRAGRAEDPDDALQPRLPPRRHRSGSCACRGGVAAGQPRLHPLPVDRLEREAQAELGWQPKHDSRETFLQTMRARGVIPAAAGAEARDLSALKSSNGSDREPVAGPAGQE